jgi:hypothetical protein
MNEKPTGISKHLPEPDEIRSVVWGLLQAAAAAGDGADHQACAKYAELLLKNASKVQAKDLPAETLDAIKREMGT